MTKQYFIKVFDPDVQEYVDAFPFDPDAVFDNYEDAQYQIREMKAVDKEQGISNKYAIEELTTY